MIEAIELTTPAQIELVRALKACRDRGATRSAIGCVMSYKGKGGAVVLAATDGKQLAAAVLAGPWPVFPDGCHVQPSLFGSREPSAVSYAGGR